MTLQPTDLKPCLLIAANVSRRGGQHYERENETVSLNDEGEEIRNWETKKTTKDTAEFAEASSIQSKAKRTISKLGAHTPIGIVVNLDKEALVEETLEQIEQEVNSYNAGSSHTKIDLMFGVFEVTGKNVRQLEKVVDSLRGVLDDLGGALNTLDPQNIREVLRRMSGYTEILPDNTARLVDNAIKNAKSKANEISKRSKRIQRLEAKINEEANGNVTTFVESQRVAAQQAAEDGAWNQVKEVRKSLRKLNKLVVSKDSEIKKLEQVKEKTSQDVVKAARFAIMKPGDLVGADDTDHSGTLQGAQQASRFANMPRFTEDNVSTQ